tara:strand:+ start:767 stop:1111 length:345 start_codon:yes stop_codon:yes gene_type:complete
MVNYLWFAEADVEESQDALMVRTDNFLGIDPVSGGLRLHFKDIEGNEAAKERIKLHCTNGNQKAVAEAFARIMTSHPHSGGSMIVVADYNVANGQAAIGAHSEFRGLVTDVTIP